MSASQIYLGSSHLIVRKIDLMNFFSIVWVFRSTKIRPGQASVERGFSINKSLVKVNMKEETTVAKKIIRDCMLANLLKPHTVDISIKLILPCSTTIQKYRQHIEEASH